MANIKECFYAIRKHLSSGHLAQIATGSACEVWLNTEARMALNSPRCPGMRKGEWAETESKKRDLIITSDKRISHVIEAKLLYPWPNGRILEKLGALKRQINEPPRNDEDAATRYVALIYAIWLDSYAEGSAAFFRRTKALLRNTFPKRRYTTQHQHTRERGDIRPCLVELQGKPIQVQTATLYIARRK